MPATLPPPMSLDEVNRFNGAGAPPRSMSLEEVTATNSELKPDSVASPDDSPGLGAIMSHVERFRASPSQMQSSKHGVGLMGGMSAMFDATQEPGQMPVPFLRSLRSTVDSSEFTSAAERIKAGTHSDADAQLIARTIVDAERAEDAPLLAKAWDTVRHIPALVGETALTRGAFSFGRNAVLGREAIRHTLPRVSTWMASRLTGVAAQTAANPLAVAAATSQRQADTVFEEGGPEPIFESLVKGFGDVAIEIGSERAGGAIGGGVRSIGSRLANSIAGKAVAKMPVAQRAIALRNGVAQRWLSSGPGRTMEALKRRVAHDGNWNGVVNEVLEERVGDAARIAAYIESPDQNVTGQLGTAAIAKYEGDEESAKKLMSKALGQLAVEGVAFAVPGLPGAVMKAGSSIVNLPAAMRDAAAASSTQADLVADEPTNYSQGGEAFAPTPSKELVRATRIVTPSDSETGERRPTPRPRELLADRDALAAWVDENPEAARAIADVEQPTRAAFSRIGLQDMVGPDDRGVPKSNPIERQKLRDAVRDIIAPVNVPTGQRIDPNDSSILADAEETDGSTAADGGSARAKDETQGFPFAQPGYEPKEAKPTGKYTAPTVKRVPMPELVRLAKSLIGKLPKINSRLKSRGSFNYYKEGSNVVDIMINPDVAANENVLAQVLAHEIGHAVDYFPDKTILRGNILGRIASLRGYTKQHLAPQAGAPGPLTDAERARLRAEAERLKTSTAQVEIEEEIRREMPVTPEDVLAIWRSLDTSKLNPELLQYIKRASTAEKLSIMRAAMKGIVPDELKRFASIIIEKTGKKTTQTVNKQPTLREIKAEWQRLIEEEIKKRDLISRDVVHAELTKLSEWWRPYDKAKASKDFKKYRNSSEEIYADAISALLNSPGELESRAPTFYKGFMSYLDSKPEFMKTLLELQGILNGTSEEIAKHRADTVMSMFANGESAFRASYQAMQEAKASTLEKVKQFFFQALLDTHAPLKSRVRKGAKVLGPEAMKYEYIADEFNRRDNVNYLMLKNIDRNVYAPLYERDIDDGDIGDYLFHRRVTKDRAKIANPGGFTPSTSAEMIESLRKKLGPERFKLLEERMARFDDIMVDVYQAAVDAGTLSQKDFDNIVVKNKGSYATFAVTKYIDGRISPAIRKQIGTFEDVANPYHATIMKLIFANRWAEVNKAKANIRDALIAMFPSEIRRVEIPYGKHEPAKRASLGNDYIIVHENGKAVAYEVPTNIAATLKSHDLGRLAEVADMIKKPTYAVLHPLYITFSAGFQFGNPFKDTRRTLRNFRAAGKKIGVNATLKDLVVGYWKAAKPALRRAMGVDDALIDRMLKSKALDVSVSALDSEFKEKNQYARLLKSHGLTAKARRGKVRRAIGMMKSTIEGVLTFQETLHKAAAFIAYENKGGDVQAVSHVVRKYISTPDYTQRGHFTVLTNGVWMYSKVQWNGLQADAELAFDPKTAAGWWWRMMTFDVMPVWGYRLALAGAFGPALAAMFRSIGDYYFTTHDVIPIGAMTGGDEDDEGKVAFFAAPTDETGKTARILAAKAFDAAIEMQGGDSRSGSVSAAASDAAGAVKNMVVPDANPFLDMASKWSQYNDGENPTNFMGKPIIPKDQFAAGGWDANRAMISWTAGQFGVASDLMQPAADRILGNRYEYDIAKPWYAKMPGMKRLIHVSDTGLREEEWAAIENEEQEQARFRLGLPVPVRKATGERYLLSRKRPRGLSDKETTRLADLNFWYTGMYLPFTQTMRGENTTPAEKSAAEEALKLSAAWLNSPADRRAILQHSPTLKRAHDKFLGNILFQATDPEPMPEDFPTDEKYNERMAEWRESKQKATAFVGRLKGMSEPELQTILESEAEDRDFKTSHTAGKKRRRLTAFGERSLELTPLVRP